MPTAAMHHRRRLGRMLGPALAALLLPCLAPGRASAHALVVASTPEAGSVLAELPPRIALRFNSRIDAARSRLQLIGAEGTAPILLSLDPGTDPTLLEAASPALAPGAWRLRWQVLAVDGHITRGDIPFTIRPPGR